MLTVRREGQGKDHFFLVPVERIAFLSRRQIPEADRRSTARSPVVGRGQRFAVGRKRQGTEDSRSRELEMLHAGRHVPELDDLFVPGPGQQPAVR